MCNRETQPLPGGFENGDKVRLRRYVAGAEAGATGTVDTSLKFWSSGNIPIRWDRNALDGGIPDGGWAPQRFEKVQDEFHGFKAGQRIVFIQPNGHSAKPGATGVVDPSTERDPVWLQQYLPVRWDRDNALCGMQANGSYSAADFLPLPTETADVAALVASAYDTALQLVKATEQPTREIAGLQQAIEERDVRIDGLREMLRQARGKRAQERDEIAGLKRQLRAVAISLDDLKTRSGNLAGAVRENL